MPAEEKDGAAVQIGRNKRILAIGSAVILFAAIGTLIVVITAPTHEINSCQAIRKASAEGRDFTLEYDVAEINACENYGCTFDVSACDIPCPLGFETDDNRCEISCRCSSDSKGTFQGDIQFDDTEVNGLLVRYGYASREQTFAVFSSSVRESAILWAEKINDRIKIPYTIDETLGESKQAIQKAISEYKEKTCIDFVPRNSEENYVTFQSGVGCWSRVGMIGGQQDVAVGKNCKSAGIIMHELMHSIGFEHEHTRPDRDAFITIDMNRVDQKYLLNFAKILDPVKNLGRPYDMGSVTHYGSKAWSISPDEYSFVKKDGTPIKGQRKSLSTEDVKEINALYECAGQGDGGGNIEGVSVLSVSASMEVSEDIENDEQFGQPYDPDAPPEDDMDENLSSTESTSTAQQTGGVTVSPSSQAVFAPHDDVSWSEWVTWSDCTQTCGISEALRFRSCMQRDGFSGWGCEGEWYDTRKCEKDACPGKFGEWQPWESWESCSRTCSMGYQWRNRKCPDGELCEGFGIDGRYCQKPEC
uniref:astacin-like metalloendopeptidase n=1 Tax=Styela clava TaxID=7725 RepID=UPI0019393403|nr:astacin-like metalloendopeptidase [Styela clava]